MEAVPETQKDEDLDLGRLALGINPNLESNLKLREDSITRYMDLAVRFGLNVQPGQEVRIECERTHADLAHKIAIAAYERGAKYVDVDYRDPMLRKIRADHSKIEADLEFLPSWMKSRIDHVVDTRVARIVLMGEENPDLLQSCDPARISKIMNAARLNGKRYLDESICMNLAQWSIVATPTYRWAEKVFPGIPREEAYLKLWDAILSSCRVDTPDWESRWATHDQNLKNRSEFLNNSRFEALRFVGPGTNLTVGLSPLARFHGGSDTTMSGAKFFANMPTEEVFTTPDYRKTEGVVSATRPFYINGTLIEGLELRFEKGELVSYAATKGSEAFGKQISHDAGAKRLGEVALVPTDSPIFRSGLLFQQTLFDENAACHIALGNSYTHCLEGFSSLTPEQLASVGANNSVIHDDLMISSPEVDVFGVQAGKEVTILKNGEWVAS